MDLERGSVGTQAFEFTLQDQDGKEVSLLDVLTKGPAMLVFYPGDFTPVCTKQLCNYRDNFDKFMEFGLQILGISANTPEDHKRFSREYDFPFPLLSDPKKGVTKAYGCTSFLMFGGISRAVVFVRQTGQIAFRYVEPTPLTHRKADALLDVIKDLRERGMI